MPIELPYERGSCVCMCHKPQIRCQRYTIAFGVSFLHSQFSIDDLVLQVSFTTFRWKDTKEIEIGD